MATCPNCGFDNRPTDRFCAQCGTPIEADASSPTTTPAAADANPTRGQQPSFMPPPVQPSFTGGSPTTTTAVPESSVEKTDFDFSQRRQPDLEDASDPEWRMSSLGPPPPKKRRLWLWILLGIIALCILACVALIVWVGFTDSGQEFFENIEATATAQAE